MENNIKPILQIESDAVAYQVNHNFYDLPDSNIRVCSLKDVKQLQRDGVIPPDTQIRIGETLLKSPYDSKYIPIRDYEFVVTKDKINHIATIAQYLGAISVDIAAGWANDEERTIDVNGNVNYKVVNVNGGYKKIDAVDIKSRYQVQMGNLQGPFNVKTYQRAIEYAREHRINDDSDIQSLFRARDICQGLVYGGDRKVTMEMSNDLNRNLEIAAKLQVMPNIFSLDTSFKEITKNRKIFKIEFIFKFP